MDHIQVITRVWQQSETLVSWVLFVVPQNTKKCIELKIRKKYFQSMKSFHLLFAFILLASCATSSQVYTPSGDKAYKIDCSGSALSKSLCEKKAGSICKTRGYNVLDYREEISPGISYGGISVGGFVSRIMTIQCK